MDPNIAKALDQLKAEMGNPRSDFFALLKGFTQNAVATQGIQGYNLEAPAKMLYPYLTPLVDSIPRTQGGYGSQANWKAITGVNTTNLSIGVAEGKRGGTPTTTIQEYYAAYRFLGLDDFVTEQAWRAAVNYQDLRVLARLNLLKAVRLWEEILHLGGNGTALVLTQPNAPTVVDDTSTTGSLTPSDNYDVVVVALTLEGLNFAGGPGLAVAATAIQQSISRGNAGPYGGSTAFNGGSSWPSNATNHGVGGAASGAVNCFTPIVPGACGYAWFCGLHSGNVALAAITTNNSVILKAVGASTQWVSALVAADYSLNALVYDGLLYQAWKTGSGAYIYNCLTGVPGVGSTLTADGYGGILEINAVLQYLWNTRRLSPNIIWGNGTDVKNIASKILADAGAVSNMRFMFTSQQGEIVGGVKAVTYLNPYGMGMAQPIEIKTHPNMPQGTLLFDTLVIPYPLTNVANVREMELRFDYIAVDWPKVQWQDEFGVYFDGVLKHYFPPAMAIITNFVPG